MSVLDLTSLLQRHFGFTSFRANQEAVCRAATDGRDVLLVMPTGAGKSLCYQLPAIARKGTALVISPLIALMDDQSQKLEAQGLRVGRIHSGLPREHARAVCRLYLDNELDFLFIAPERLRVPGFPEMLAKRPLALIAIDEAHCISQWGHDFRPDYRALRQRIEPLRPAPVIALTATATPLVQKDIVAQLGLNNPALFIHGFRRANLAVEVAEVPKPQRHERARTLLEPVERRPAIIYAPSRKDADTLAAELGSFFPSAAYHAGLDPSTRERVQREFQAGKLHVVVATVAFGMGIDKADVRTVIHTSLPMSVEAFYQEIGRAGRDGLPSRTILMHSWADRRMQDFLLERNYPPIDVLASIDAQLGETPIHADDLRAKLHLDIDTFDPALDKLIVQGVASIDYDGNVLRIGRTGSTNWRTGYEQQLNSRRTQIENMMRFANNAECRMAALIRHFGDLSDSSRVCGICDFCLPESSIAQQFREPTHDEAGEFHRILQALANSSRGTSTGKLHTELYPTSRIDRKEFDNLLEALFRAGLISIENATFTTGEGDIKSYRRVSITHDGGTIDPDGPLPGVVMLDIAPNGSSRKSKSSTTRAKKPAAPHEEVNLTNDQQQLEKALKAWRTAIARELKQPPFVIFGDRTLRQIVVDRPSTPDDLAQVNGMGPVKVARWGEDICRLCNA